MRVNAWLQLRDLIPGTRRLKGNVTGIGSDGSYAIATADGATILARPLPGQDWDTGDGVFVEDGRIVDSAPSLPGVAQYV